MKAVICDICGKSDMVEFDEDLRVLTKMDGRMVAFDLCTECQSAVREVLVNRCPLEVPGGLK